MTTTVNTSKTVISEKSAKAQRLISNAHTQAAVKDIKKAQGHDVDDDEDDEKEVETPEVKVDEKALEAARAKVDKTKAEFELAKAELAKLIGKPLKVNSGPGVIQSILTIVTESGKVGVTKEQILEKLVHLFPERESEGMKKTIQVQLPHRLSVEKHVNVIKTDDGKFLIKSK